MGLGHRAELTFRGARGIFSARGPYNPPPPAGPNSEFPEIRKIKKYQYVYHDVKNCLYIKTRTYVHQFELSYNPTYSNNNNLTIIRELNKVKVKPSQPTKHS